MLYGDGTGRKRAPGRTAGPPGPILPAGATRCLTRDPRSRVIAAVTQDAEAPMFRGGPWAEAFMSQRCRTARGAHPHHSGCQGFAEAALRTVVTSWERVTALPGQKRGDSPLPDNSFVRFRRLMANRSSGCVHENHRRAVPHQIRRPIRLMTRLERRACCGLLSGFSLRCAPRMSPSICSPIPAPAP